MESDYDCSDDELPREDVLSYGDVDEPYSHAEAERLIQENNARRLIRLTISIGLNEEDLAWAQDVLLRLAANSDRTVRGNAVLSFGHLARRFGTLDESRIKPVIEAALLETDWHVHGQAEAAADDVQHFLGWRIDPKSSR